MVIVQSPLVVRTSGWTVGFHPLNGPTTATRLAPGASESGNRSVTAVSEGKALRPIIVSLTFGFRVGFFAGQRAISSLLHSHNRAPPGSSVWAVGISAKRT